ncbi:hypothetical protein ACIP4U_30295 [Streptomyces caelestis]|uniref:hypothetical protein n=1 Tax=Streptomyces caelestis TaxID=36816 RepID=UPI00381E8359
MQAWDRAHPRLTHRAAWLDHEGELPLIEGTLVRLEVEHLSKDRAAPAVWLWSSKIGADDADVDRAWQAFLRRFDLEQTFRLFKQTLGWTRPRLREPEAADRWTWLVIAAYTQLRLARPVTRDLRHQVLAEVPKRPPHPRGCEPVRCGRLLPGCPVSVRDAGRSSGAGRWGFGALAGQGTDVGKTIRREKTLIDLQRLKG